MLYVTTNENGQTRAIDADSDEGRQPGIYRTAQSRWDWKTFEAAAEVAAKLNTDAAAAGLVDAEGHTLFYLATDAGPHQSPRYDVIQAPSLGTFVSKSFNGDSYPIGKIVKIGKDFSRIYVERASNPEDILCFYRRKLSGRWILKGGTWGLIEGHHNERNPHF
jgi:hypothetical protein